jgi:PAS domain S-box-containing protein
MQTNSTKTEIEAVKNQIINVSLIFASVIGFITYIISLTRYSKTGPEISFLSDIILLLPVIGITIFRKKVSIKVKSLTIICVIYILFLVHVSHYGIFTGDKVLIILIPFLSLIAFSLRVTIAIFIIILISFIFLAYLTLSGNITVYQQNPATLSTWLINILLLTIVAFVIIVMESKFNQVYTKLITTLENNNKLISDKERNYREIFNASTDAIFLHDLDGKILDVNKSMLKIYGYEQADIDKLTIADLSSQKEGFTSFEAAAFVQKAINGEPQVFDWQAKKKNGDLFWTEVALKKSMIGDHERVLAIVRDITEKKEDALQLSVYRTHLKDLVIQKTKELEQANEELHATNESLSQQKEELISTLNVLHSAQENLVESEKMSSLGILTAGVAHEINNPLNFIAGGIEGLETYFIENINDHSEKVAPLINAVQVGVKRVTEIVHSLNHYNRRDDLPFIDCNINSIIDNCLVMLNNQFNDRIEVRKSYTDIPVKVPGNEGKLHQAILNVILNAVQSIRETGVITINTTLEDSHILVTVSDTGCGIKEEHIGKIFDPFFTTRDPGKGTGLGLSITYSIIKEHQGSIDVKSELGKGTKTLIRLPINSECLKI